MAAKKKAKKPADRRAEADWPEPAPSQVWKDDDKRGANAKGRTVVIIELLRGKQKGKAFCSVFLGGEDMGRTTTISVDRMAPGRGYSYVSGRKHELRREAGEPQHMGTCERCGLTNVGARGACAGRP